MLIMKTCVRIFFENNAFIISNKLLKLENMDWTTD